MVVQNVICFGGGRGGRVGKNTSVCLPMFDSYDSFNHRGGISRLVGTYLEEECNVSIWE